MIFYFIFLIALKFCFNKIQSYKTWNWDDDFLNKFIDLASDPDDNSYNYIKVLNLLADCYDNPEEFDEIENMCQAIKHFKKKTGKEVVAKNNLLEHMKDFTFCIFDPIVHKIKKHGYKTYNQVKSIIEKSIKSKILDKRTEGLKKAIIQNEPDSYYGLWYLTLGSYSLNIEYKKEVDLSKNLFQFEVHFFGKDYWDFEDKKCGENNIFCFLENIIEESIPRLFIGEGKSFYVSYDFYDTITVDMNSNDLMFTVKDECIYSNSELIKNYIVFLLILLLTIF